MELRGRGRPRSGRKIRSPLTHCLRNASEPLIHVVPFYFARCKGDGFRAGLKELQISFTITRRLAMKKITLLCFLLSSLCARADMVITETMEGAGQNMTMTLKIKGDKVRTDVSPQMSTIMDTASGDTITIMHPQKSYMKMSASKTKELMEQMKKMRGTPAAAETPAAKPKLVDTGKSEKVNNYNAEIYTMETPTAKITCWITKDFPNYAAVQEQMKKLQSGILSKLGSDLAPDTSEAKGLPVKTQIVTNGQTMTVTILSAKEQPVADAEMVVPPDYQEISMPGFGGAGGS